MTGGSDAGGAFIRRIRAFMEIAAVSAAPDHLFLPLEYFTGLDVLR